VNRDPHTPSRTGDAGYPQGEYDASAASNEGTAPNLMTALMIKNMKLLLLGLFLGMAFGVIAAPYIKAGHE